MVIAEDLQVLLPDQESDAVAVAIVDQGGNRTRPAPERKVELRERRAKRSLGLMPRPQVEPAHNQPPLALTESSAPELSCTRESGAPHRRLTSEAAPQLQGIRPKPNLPRLRMRNTWNISTDDIWEIIQAGMIQDGSAAICTQTQTEVPAKVLQLQTEQQAMIGDEPIIDERQSAAAILDSKLATDQPKSNVLPELPSQTEEKAVLEDAINLQDGQPQMGSQPESAPCVTNEPEVEPMPDMFSYSESVSAAWQTVCNMTADDIGSPGRPSEQPCSSAQHLSPTAVKDVEPPATGTYIFFTARKDVSPARPGAAEAGTEPSGRTTPSPRQATLAVPHVQKSVLSPAVFFAQHFHQVAGGAAEVQTADLEGTAEESPQYNYGAPHTQLPAESPPAIGTGTAGQLIVSIRAPALQKLYSRMQRPASVNSALAALQIKSQRAVGKHTAPVGLIGEPFTGGPSLQYARAPEHIVAAATAGVTHKEPVKLVRSISINTL